MLAHCGYFASTTIYQFHQQMGCGIPIVNFYLIVVLVYDVDPSVSLGEWLSPETGRHQLSPARPQVWWGKRLEVPLSPVYTVVLAFWPMQFSHTFFCKEILFTGRASLSTPCPWTTASMECSLSRPSFGRASQLALGYLGNPGMESNSGLNGRVGQQNMVGVRSAPPCPALSESLTEVSEI